jgi:predicted nucleotidyltransferase
MISDAIRHAIVTWGRRVSSGGGGYILRMSSLADASLTSVERRVLGRFLQLAQDEYGSDLHAVWLYGSRARGEEARPESDVDLLLVVEGDEFENLRRATRLELDATLAERASSTLVSVHVYSPERLAQRREIRSFFIQEVDRDKIVLYGNP